MGVLSCEPAKQTRAAAQNSPPGLCPATLEWRKRRKPCSAVGGYRGPLESPHEPTQRCSAAGPGSLASLLPAFCRACYHCDTIAASFNNKKLTIQPNLLDPPLDLIHH